MLMCAVGLCAVTSVVIGIVESLQICHDTKCFHMADHGDGKGTEENFFVIIKYLLSLIFKFLPFNPFFHFTWVQFFVKYTIFK
jgi:hypothetical protein